MRIYNIPFGRPLLSDKERNAVNKVMFGHVLTHGEKCKEFEKNFSKYIGVKHAVTTSNCTTALHLSLKSLNIGYEDEVICPDLTFIAPANMIVSFGKTDFQKAVSGETIAIPIKKQKQEEQHKVTQRMFFCSQYMQDVQDTGEVIRRIAYFGFEPVENTR